MTLRHLTRNGLAFRFLQSHQHHTTIKSNTVILDAQGQQGLSEFGQHLADQSHLDQVGLGMARGVECAISDSIGNAVIIGQSDHVAVL